MRQPVTALLRAVGEGDGEAAEQLWRAVYQELRQIARRQMACEPPGHTLQPTALVHEVWVRLFGSECFSFQNRRHFFSAAAHAMRELRVESARKRKRQKRGGSAGRVPLEGNEPVFEDDAHEVLAVSEALEQLATIDKRKAEVVMLRYFAGLTVEE
ncbi:MAG: RNA polymerase subunit sigma, partial [Planctomycetota bacterium]